MPASKVPDAGFNPSIKSVMGVPDDKLLNISKVFNYEIKEDSHSFDRFVREECGDMTVMRYGRIVGEEKGLYRLRS